jgi:hypothetical protein
MITVPEQFAQWRAPADGDAGREWVRSLPARVERLSRQWHDCGERRVEKDGTVDYGFRPCPEVSRGR